MEKADLVFTTSKSIVSAAIKFRTHGIWSHVMLATGEGDDVISADAYGVILRAMEPDEKENYACLFCPGISVEAQAIIKLAASKIGKGYDFLGLASFLVDSDLNNEDRWFCSELVYMVYAAAGIQLLERIEHAFVSPRDLWISPVLRRRF